MAYMDNYKVSPKVPSASSNDSDERKIFVGGLSWGTTQGHLEEYFSQFGEILDCILKVDPVTRRSRGFGFILFADAATVDKVLGQTHMLQGRTITPRKARKGGTKVGKGREPVLKVFVGGLDPAVPETEIWEHFEAYGKVSDLDLPYDRNKGCRRAFCFVTFQTEDAVEAVCKDNKQEIGGKWVDVKKATPKTFRNTNGWFGGAAAGAGGAGYNSGYGGSGAYSAYNNGYGSGGYGNQYGNQYGSYTSGYGNRAGYNSRGYSSGGGYSQPQGDWGRQQGSNYGSGGGYGYYNNYNNNYSNNNYDHRD